MTTSEPGSATMEHLVDRLRNVTEDDAYALPWTFGVTCREAADAIETLTRERDEALEALKPWQPIDTAPTESFGCFAQSCVIGTVTWGKEGRSYTHVGPIVWQGPNHGWEFTELDFDMFASPTHWCAFPAPPEAGREIADGGAQE